MLWYSKNKAELECTSCSGFVLVGRGKLLLMMLARLHGVLLFTSSEIWSLLHDDGFLVSSSGIMSRVKCDVLFRSWQHPKQ